MIAIHAGLRSFVYALPTDMRKGFNGLQGLVQQTLQEDPLSGHLFLFINRRADRLKVLYWDRDGFALWYKRLEHGTFQMPAIAEGQTKAEIRSDELVMLSSGVDMQDIKRRKRFSLTG